MSTRTSSRKKIPTSRLAAEDLDTPRSRRVGRPSRNAAAADEDGLSSRGSSPGSRPVTPAAKSKRGRKSVTTGRPKKRGSGANTPANRQSRASSVSSSTAKIASASARKSHKKSRGGKSKSSATTGSYKETDYHYGSDFEGNDYDNENESDESDSDVSDIESVSDDMKPESDVELEPNLIEEDDTEVAFWLEDPSSVPKLELPESSDDLLLLPEPAMEAICIYEVMRQFYKIIRLSPFRFEDFCASLVSPDQSSLISEIHISLLKALLREDEAQQAQYGPLDQKDSMNVFINFIDPITWPENLKFYLSTEPEVYKEALHIMSTCEYPFTNLENKIKVLKCLTDALLNTSAVREDLHNEGSLPLEDHCRVCHKLGDMIICEHCNGPFHGHCLDPPMYEVPEEDWICPVCCDNMVEGVYDCLSTNPGSCRIQQLGVDRNGSRYWFASRRVWVSPNNEQSEPSYYSTRAQLTELIEAIDKDLYEKDLYNTILTFQEDMEKQMDVTEKLTRELNSKGFKSYLETDNMVLDKLQQERNDLREHLEAEKRKVQQDIDRQIKEEEEDRRRKMKEQERKEKEEKLQQLRKEREERLWRRVGGEPKPEEEGGDKTEQMEVEEEDDKMEVDEKIKALEEEIKQEEEEAVKETSPLVSPNKQVTNNYKGPSEIKALKRGTMPAGPFYRLGEEYTYKNYTNQYSIYTYALSRAQAKEDIEKRSRMSHKFSLTDVCGFKWSGALMGNRNTLAGTVRNTILALENNIPVAFMHTNWPLLRKPWIQAVSSCNNPSKDFSRALTVLTCCIKPCILLPVWTESLGHTLVKKTGHQGKEEKKRQEKREKKEREEEEERLKPFMTWVKYTLPVKSLGVVRQKGEEYRAHGRNGWLWVSSTRSSRPVTSTTAGLRAGPHRIAVKYTEIKTGISKVVLMEPKALNFLLEAQKERDRKALGKTGEEEEETDVKKEEKKEEIVDLAEDDKDSGLIDVEKQEEEKRKESLTKVLDISRMDLMHPKKEDLGGDKGVVNVSDGIAHPTRILYPRCGKKTKLDDLLQRRIQLKSLEEKRIDPLKEEDDDKKKLDSSSLDEWIKVTLAKLTAQVDAISRLQTGQLTCYSPQCRRQSVIPAGARCYSPSCVTHTQTNKLTEAANVYNTAVSQGQERFIKKLSSCDSEVKFTYTVTALSAINHLISVVKAREEELNYESMLQSLSANTNNKPDIKADKSDVKKEEDIKSEPGDLKSQNKDSQETKRIYSDPDTSKPITLSKLPSPEKKTNRIVKYPLAPTFWSKLHSKRNILINSKHELRRLARQAGMVSSDGFNYNSKANQSAWPYPCPRPTFKTTWLYRTAGMTSLHNVALQLRVLWACIRWDDMNTKPPNPDGKNSVTTDSEIVTTEILKHRNIGRYLEHTQYYQRRVCIPLDAPRKQVDYLPIRSGLRKRKRAESPVQAEPQVEEKWIDETDLELWEIFAYRDKLERDKDVAITRTNNGRSIKAPERYDPSEMESVRKRSTTNSDMKAKIDAQIKEQREAFKASRSTTPDLPNSSKPSLSGIRKDNTIKMEGVSGNTTYTTSLPGVGGAKKVFLTKDGKILGHQIIGGNHANKIPIPAISKTPVVPSAPTPAPQPTAASPTTQQKVQIVKTADGKIQVRGLMPGQQLVQMPDGKLQIFSSTNSSPGLKLITTGAAKSPSNTTSIQTVAGQQQHQASPQILNRPTAAGHVPIINKTGYPTLPRSNVISGVTPIQPKPAASTSGMLPGGLQLAGASPATSAGGPRVQLIQPSSQPTSINSVPMMNVGTSNGMSPGMLAAKPSLPTSSAVNTPGVIQTAGSPMGVSSSSSSHGQQPVAPATASPAKTNTLVGIQSLGQNTITMKDGQLIVQGPDQEAATNIARQLASGQAKIANLQGKQVLLITNPNQNKQQVAAAQDQAVAAPAPQQPVNLISQQQPQQIPKMLLSPQKQVLQPQQIVQQQPQQVLQQQAPQQQVVTHQQQPHLVAQQQQQPLVQQHQVMGPQGEVTSVTVSAQLVQTEQGPRIILQGLQGINLSPEQLQNIQQQVKTQLLKQQALARQQGKVPPTKVSLELALSSGSPQIQPSQPSASSTLTPAPQVTPTSPQVTPAPSNLVTSASASPLQVNRSGDIQTSGKQPDPADPGRHVVGGRQGVAKSQSQTMNLNALPEEIIKQGKYIIRDGKKMLVLPQHVMQQYQQTLKQQKQQQQQQQPQLLSPSQQQHVGSGGKGGEEDKFELTDDYIQQTIKEALESGNLTPDLQEKLMNQLNDETMKVNKVKSSGRKIKKKDEFDPLTGERMDEEWEPTSWSAKAKINNQIKIQTSTGLTTLVSKEKEGGAVTNILSSPQLGGGATAVSGDGYQHQQHQQVKQQQQVSTRHHHHQDPTAAVVSSSTEHTTRKKFTLYTANRLNTMLFKHKEQLKKDIARKRSILEKDLMMEIQREIESLKKQAALKLGSEQAAKMIATRGGTNANNASPAANVKTDQHSDGGRKRKAEASPNVGKVSSAGGQQSARKRHKSDDKMHKERMYCICKTRYDPTKFYVGCDICSNWFHGTCVGITPKMSKKLTEYVCDECTNAKLGTEKYCLCKQPYDDSKFYIGCEQCDDWLHGRCVGILQAEAEGIQEYECPKCNPKYPMNMANLKKLKGQDLDSIKKLLKQIVSSKHSAPFRKPVDKRTNKKYYELIKEPMDLETVDKKLEREEYKTLAEFLGDLTRITENCRYFYPPESVNSKHAEQLEVFILDKVGSIRQKLLERR